jgi:transposase
MVARRASLDLPHGISETTTIETLPDRFFSRHPCTILFALINKSRIDMSRWKTEAHSASWLGLCPDNRTSGDKVLSRGTRRVVNRAPTALRMAAVTLMRSHPYLGAHYRRLRRKLGAPKAITAMAHRLARLVYRMLKYGQRYVDKGAEYYEHRYRQQQIEFLTKKAVRLGLQITPAQS